MKHFYRILMYSILISGFLMSIRHGYDLLVTGTVLGLFLLSFFILYRETVS